MEQVRRFAARSGRWAVVGVLFLLAAGAQAESGLQPDDVVARRGEVALTVAMVDARVADIPEAIRPDYLDDPGRMNRMIDVSLAQLQFAAEARRLGLELPASLQDADAQAQTDALAKALLQHAVQPLADEQYEALAAERYKADRRSYASEATYTLRHLRVSSERYGEAGAKVIADAALGRARNGEDFAALVQEYSDLEGEDEFAGDVSVSALIRWPAALQDALKALRGEPGITDALLGPDGWHILQLVKVNPPVVPSYDEVHDQILAEVRKETEHAARTAYMKTFIDQDTELNEEVIGQLFTRYYTHKPASTESADGSKPAVNSKPATAAAPSA